MSKVKEWIMPAWMEPYRALIGNTGGNTIEDLLNRLETQKWLSQTNIIVFTMSISVQEQIALLERLHADGRLTDLRKEFAE